MKTKDLMIKIDGAQIGRATTIKYLGLTIDEHLNWNEHTNTIRKRIASMSGAMRRVAILPVEIRTLIYNAHILPIINYCITAWAQTKKTNIQSIKIIMNKALKYIHKLPRLTPTTELYYLTKQLPIDKLILNY